MMMMIMINQWILGAPDFLTKPCRLDGCILLQLGLKYDSSQLSNLDAISATVENDIFFGRQTIDFHGLYEYSCKIYVGLHGRTVARSLTISM